MSQTKSSPSRAACAFLNPVRATWSLGLALALTSAAPCDAGRFPGGGKNKRSDCYAEFEVENVAAATRVDCMEGTACDADGQCDGQCTLNVALCLDETDPKVPHCTPRRLVIVTSHPTLEIPDLASPGCGGFTGVVVPLGTKKRDGTPKPGKGRVVAIAVADGKPKRDKDILNITCTPNPGCGSTTTTTTTLPPCGGVNANPAGGPDALDLVVASSGTDLDIGWTGISHNFPVVANSTLKACLRTCGPDGTPPCDLQASVGPDTPNGETFGAPLPLLAAGVPVCVVNQWNPTVGTPAGTADPLTGELHFQINLTSKVHLTSPTQVCPRCRNARCDGGPNQNKRCAVDATLLVGQASGDRTYELSRACPPDPGALAAPLDIRLPLTSGTATLTGPKPCVAEPGEPRGVPVQDDNCLGSGCGTDCTGSACVGMTIDPSSGNPICIDAKGGLAQNCCGGTPCFPTAGGGSIVRTGKPAIPSPPFPDPTYPKTSDGVLASIFCIPGTGTNSIDSASGLPGPGALVAPIHESWTHVAVLTR